MISLVLPIMATVLCFVTSNAFVRDHRAGPGLTLLWSIDFFFRSVCRSRRAGKIAKLFFFWLQYVDDIIPEKYAIDAANGVFFMGRKSVDHIVETCKKL